MVAIYHSSSIRRPFWPLVVQSSSTRRPLYHSSSTRRVIYSYPILSNSNFMIFVSSFCQILSRCLVVSSYFVSLSRPILSRYLVVSSFFVSLSRPFLSRCLVISLFRHTRCIVLTYSWVFIFSERSERPAMPSYRQLIYRLARSARRLSGCNGLIWKSHPKMSSFCI